MKGKKSKIWNLPNKLTMARMLSVPIFMVVMLLPESVLPFTTLRAIGALLFILTSLTDMLDGKIARKYGLITDFGKFMDPIADKIMVFGAMICLLVRCPEHWLMYLVMISVTVFREFTVTSMRLIMASRNTVVAANSLGKIKTVAQIVFIVAALIEPSIYYFIENVFLGGAPIAFAPYIPLTYLSALVTLVFTVWSGANYICTYWKYLDEE